MLISIQKKLTHTSCPSCKKTKVLQATLACSRDDKKCATTCQCSHCGLNLIVSLPENANELNLERADLSIVCDLITSQCEITASHPLPPLLKAA